MSKYEMSFALTPGAIVKRRKTVTRRIKDHYKVDDIIIAVVEKGQTPLALLRITDVRFERLDAITENEMVKEGLGNLALPNFVEMMSNLYKISGSDLITRIEFEYT